MIDSVVDVVKQTVSQNEFFSGGLVLGVIGGIIAAARGLPIKLWAFIIRKTTVSLDVHSSEEAFKWLQLWLHSQRYTKRARRWVLATSNESSNTPGPYRESMAGAQPTESPSESKGLPTLVPAPGMHIFWYNRRIMWLNYSREPMKMGDVLLGYHETMMLRTIGGNSETVLNLLTAARKIAVPEPDKVTSIMFPVYSSWRKARSVTTRPLHTVILEDNMLDVILSDIKRFRSERERYHELGVPYRRGYLLWGPPGNGKSSAVVAIAGALGLDVNLLPIASVSSDSGLVDLLSDVETDSIICVEDIDKLEVAGAEPRNEKSDEKVTLVGLLNALDGVGAPEGRVLFATANSLENIPPVLIRPGRIDVVFNIGNANGQQADEMFHRFYPTSDGEYTDRLRAVVKDETVSMAALQCAFLANEGDPDAALDTLDGTT